MAYVTLNIDGDDIELSDPESEWFHVEPFPADANCPYCGGEIAEYVDGWQGHDDDCEEKDWHPDQSAVGAWANSASIRIKDDEIQVSISVGDPRGGFQMSIRKTEEGRMFMHVPHPSDGALHESLKEIHPGTYEVNG